MDSEKTLTAVPAGACILCGRRILTSYEMIPAVRKPTGGAPLYTMRAHTSCADLARQGLTGAELAAGRAAVDAALNSFERLYARMLAAGLALGLAGEGAAG